MKSFLVTAVLLAAVFAVAQEPKDGLAKPKIRASGTVSKAPVTQAEARAVFVRTETMLSKALRKKTDGKSAVPSGDTPVTRAQIIREMDRLFELYKPQFKFTPKKTTLENRPLKPKDPKETAALTKLIEWGFVGKISPVAVGPADTFTVQEFGDAIGFFIARTAQLTHLPTPKWTPALGAGGG